MPSDERASGWAVLLLCVAVTCWLTAVAAFSLAVAVPRRLVRRRPRYRGAHAEGRVIA